MRTSNEPKLVLHHYQMAAFRNILNLSREYYINTCAKLSNDVVFLTELSLNQLKLLHINKIYKKVLEKIECYQYTHKFSIDFEGCLHLLSAILPVENLQWYVKTKDIVLEYCVAVLKINGVIPNMPTYQPALPQKEVLTINSSIDWSTDIDDETQW